MSSRFLLNRGEAWRVRLQPTSIRNRVSIRSSDPLNVQLPHSKAINTIVWVKALYRSSRHCTSDIPKLQCTSSEFPIRFSKDIMYGGEYIWLFGQDILVPLVLVGRRSEVIHSVHSVDLGAFHSALHLSKDSESPTASATYLRYRTTHFPSPASAPLQ